MEKVYYNYSCTAQLHKAQIMLTVTLLRVSLTQVGNDADNLGKGEQAW